MKTKLIMLTLALALTVYPAFCQKKVALVTFFSDKKIGGTGLGSTIESLINDPNFNLQPLVDKSYKRFIEEYAKDLPFELIDQQVISSNERYKNYKSKIIDTTKLVNQVYGVQYAIAQGFILAYGENQGFLKEENRDPCNLIKMFDTADGTLFVSMDYEFVSRLLGVAAAVQVNLTIALYNKQCEKVFRIRESGESKGKVPSVGGIPVMDPKKIQPLCEDATEVLFEELKGKLAKIIRKSAKNL